MDKRNPNILQSLNFKNQYDVIRHDRVSWRKKSSYRKPIKRRMNKSLRRGIKLLLQNLTKYIGVL